MEMVHSPHSEFYPWTAVCKQIQKVYCKIPENIHTPSTEKDWNFLGVGRYMRPKHLKKTIKLNWKFQTGGCLEKNLFPGGGINIFSEILFNFLGTFYTLIANPGVFSRILRAFSLTSCG